MKDKGLVMQDAVFL